MTWTNYFAIYWHYTIRFRRFSVFISTHSDPITGDLHIGPNNCGSALITDVRIILIYGYYFTKPCAILYKLLPVFFPPKFRKLLKESNGSMLNMMACGAVSTVRQSNLCIQAFAKLLVVSSLLPDNYLVSHWLALVVYFDAYWLLPRLIFSRP